jgi:ABC-type branched-subunit amino acid transport system substrate-binding protein
MLPQFLKINAILLLGLVLNGCLTTQEPAPIRGAGGVQTHRPVASKGITEETLEPGVTEFAEAGETLAGSEVHDGTGGGHKVALLLPLSGKHAALGKAMQRAAELALFDKADNQIELSIHDTKSTPDGARQAANLAIQNQAGLILGPIVAEEVKAVAEVARNNNVNVIAFSNNKAVAGNGVFTLGFSPEEQIQTIAMYAAKNGKKNLAVLSPHSTYGQLLDREVNRLSQEGQVQLTEIVHYSPDMKNPNKELNPLQNLHYDVLFIPEGGQALNTLLTNMQNANIKLDHIKLLGTGQWDEPQTLQNPSLFGSWIAGPEPSALRMFDEKYVSAYGQNAPRLTSLAYDAIAMLPVLHGHFSQNPYSIQALTQPRGFEGVNGVFRFLPDGTAERKLAILEVTPAGLKILQPSAKSF